MSRRKDKAWENFISRHRTGGGELVHIDWRAAGDELGVPVDDFCGFPPGPDDEIESWDEEGLREAVKDAFYHPDGGSLAPLVMVTLMCQRCETRHDTWRLRASGWKLGDDGWELKGLRLSSEAWSRDIGDSISELFRRFDGKSMTFDCPCGVRGLQFSPNSIMRKMENLAPEAPIWGPSSGVGERMIVWPQTERATIRG